MINQTFVKFLLNNKITILIIFYWILLFIGLKTNLEFTKHLGSATICLILDIIFDNEDSIGFLKLLIIFFLYKTITCFF